MPDFTTDAKRDGNFVPTLLAVSSDDGVTPVKVAADPTTGRILVDLPGGSGTVTSVSVASANGFAGTVADPTTTPEITIQTTVTGILKGNGTAVSAAVANTDYQSPVALTTLGTSGAATFNGTTLNIPQYQAAGTYVTSVTGTADRITSSGGTTPAIDIAATYVGQASITTLGTIATGVWNAGAVTSSGLVTGTAFVPTSNSAPSNGIYLAAANTLGFAINSAAELHLTGTALSPAADGGSSLGTTSLGWQNLFGNTGFVFNIENGDWVATHTAGILTVGTGDLRVTNAGTNAASAVTVGGTQTLTNKTLTSPTVNSATLGGTATFAEGGAISYDSASSADGVYTGFVRAGTAGATLAFGDLVYLAAADSRWELADADSVTTSDRFLGMCVLAAAADGDPTIILLTGFIRADAAFPALTIGSPVYVGETAGDIQTSIPTGADNVIRRVGYAWTADELYFNPSMDSQTTVA